MRHITASVVSAIVVVATTARADVDLHFDVPAQYTVVRDAYNIDVNATPSVARRVPSSEQYYGDASDGALNLTNTLNTVNPAEMLTQDAAASAATITVNATGSFVAGDLVLIVQMQGYTATSGDQASVSSPGSVGRFELQRVASKTGTTLTFDANIVPGGLRHSYLGTGYNRAQVVHLPEYSDVTIGAAGRLEAPTWDGNRRGVVGFVASGTVTIDGTVTAAGFGFRGGSVNGNSSGNSLTDLNCSTNNCGYKGEGIDRHSYTDGLDGRGNYANAGGGGNPHDAGGGGGANAGAGGFGGREANTVGSEVNTRGMPGVAIAAPLDARIFFGGGGGAGATHNGGGGAGSRGGGIVFIVAPSITGTGTITARGTDGLNSNATNHAGGGGGGAGGSIYLLLRDAPATALNLDAAGGKGGDVVNTNYYLGPGGGGGGGRVYVAAGYGSANVSTANGIAGVNYKTPADGYDSMQTPGVVGVDADGGYLQLATAATGVTCLSTAVETLASGHSGALRYLLSRDSGASWEYWDSSAWVPTTRRADAISAATLAANIPSFGAPSGFNVRVYFNGIASETPAIDRLLIVTCGCGNGFQESGEACDDGNTDECAGTCNATCTATVNITGCGDGHTCGGETCDDGDTDNCTGACNDTCTGSASITGCGDGFTCGGEACDDGNTDDCTGTCNATCTSTVTLTGCGDGVVCGTEECDDDNSTNGDGCDNDCHWSCPTNTSCVDADPCNGDESCDTPTHRCQAGTALNDNTPCGSAPDRVCRGGACTLVSCGNNFQDPGEQCDDGNNQDCVGNCNSTCTVSITGCGDGVRCGSEACDDGNTQNCVGACNATCTVAITGCGDGVRCGSEACDDGNTDDCTGSCNAACTAAVTITGCGDGVVCGSEECDDDDRTNGDGCSRNCQVETGYVCDPGSPSVCHPVGTDAGSTDATHDSASVDARRDAGSRDLSGVDQAGIDRSGSDRAGLDAAGRDLAGVDRINTDRAVGGDRQGNEAGGVDRPAAIDGDGDGIANAFDNCPGFANADQADWDDDGIGNVCDEDADNDGVVDDLTVSGGGCSCAATNTDLSLFAAMGLIALLVRVRRRSQPG